MASPQVRVEGMRELRRSLKKMSEDDTYKTELRGAHKRVASIVSDAAQANARRGATTKMGKHATMGHVAIASIRPLAGQARATIAGGRGAPQIGRAHGCT